MGTAVSTHGGGGRRQMVASWWRSRYGAQLMLEIAICGGLLIIYRAIRGFNKSDLQTAFSNAREIISLEQWLGLPFEDDLQGWLLDHPTLIKLLNHYYIWFHFPVAIALLLWLFVRHADRYRPFRNLMAFATFSALVIHLLFPLAPPRMIPGFVDTMRVFGPSIYPPNALEGAANQIAAMPSLHFGWALIEAIAVISVLRSPWRWVIVVHPVLMTLAIIATANHWWIDAAAAALLIVGAIAVGRALNRWVGERRWSWARMRFRTDEGIEQLETIANESSDESEVARVAASEPSDEAAAPRPPSSG
jgi:hypothetical protein